MKPVVLLALTLLLPVAASVAQDAPALARGARVRVTGPNRRVVGQLESIDSATIVVRRQRGDLVTLERAAPTSLDVSAGPGSCSPGRRGSCVALGFLGGAVVGIGVGAIAVSGCHSELCGLYYLLTVPAGAVLGTIVGAVVGGEHWERVEMPARITFAPDARGNAVRVALRVPF